MESVFRTITRQTAKIIKILTKLTENKSQNNEQIDLALFAAIKIQKCVEKYMDSPEVSEVRDSPHREVEGKKLTASEPMLEVAWANIQNFRQATAKLQSKINVLINQSEHKAHRHHHHSQHEPYLLRKEQRTKPAKLHRKKPNTVDPPQQHPSRSLSQIDHSILKISNQITTLMAQGKGLGESKDESEVEEYGQ